MARFKVMRVRTVTTAEIYEVEGDHAAEAAIKEGRHVLSAPISNTSTVCSAIIEEERYDFSWLKRLLGRARGA